MNQPTPNTSRECIILKPKTTDSDSRHRDAFGQQLSQRNDGLDDSLEYYLRPKDGRLSELKVQYTGPKDPSTKRSWIQSARPSSQTALLIKVSYWACSAVLDKEGQWNGKVGIGVVFTWPLACICLLFLVIKRGGSLTVFTTC